MKAGSQALWFRATAVCKAIMLMLGILILGKVGVGLFRDAVVDLGSLPALLAASAAIYLLSWAIWCYVKRGETGDGGA